MLSIDVIRNCRPGIAKPIAETAQIRAREEAMTVALGVEVPNVPMSTDNPITHDTFSPRPQVSPPNLDDALFYRIHRDHHQVDRHDFVD